MDLWPVRSIAAGAAGTAMMTLSYAVERRLRDTDAPLDYDDGLVPGKIVASIMHLGSVSDKEDEELGYALRAGYGSAFGLWHGILRRRYSEPAASGLFGLTLVSLTFSMFPLLGHTPPPWRWRPDVLATCLGTHSIYVAAVALTDRELSRRGPVPRPR